MEAGQPEYASEDAREGDPFADGRQPISGFGISEYINDQTDADDDENYCCH